MEFTEEDYRLVAGHYDKMVPWKLAWGASVAILINRGASIRVLGSGTLFQIADEPLIVTAAHVLEEGQGHNLLFVAAGEDHLIRLEGDGILDSTGKTDIAVLRILPKHAEKVDPSKFLRFDHVSLEEITDDALFAVFGFPEMMAVYENTTLKITKYFHLANSWEGEPSGLANFDKRFHFHISADLSEIRGMNGKPAEFNYPGGQPALFPRELKGISGGSVWKIASSPYDKQSDGSKARLVGVETSIFHKPGCIRATRWKAVVGMLSNAIPELAPAIELWRPA